MDVTTTAATIIPRPMPPRPVMGLIEDLYDNRRGIVYEIACDHTPGGVALKGRTLAEWLDVVTTTAPKHGVELPTERRALLAHVLDRPTYDALFMACGGDRTPRVRMCPGCGTRPMRSCECAMED